MKFNEDLNFCRIFELPKSYPEGFLFGGGKPITFTMIDWFSPIPHEDLPSWGGTVKPWSEYVPMLKDFLKSKIYIKPGKTYLLITDFGESLIFTGKGPEEE